MGVGSDDYLAEESGLEWYTAAVKPSFVMGEQREAALAAAAEIC